MLSLSLLLRVLFTSSSYCAYHLCVCEHRQKRLTHKRDWLRVLWGKRRETWRERVEFKNEREKLEKISLLFDHENERNLEISFFPHLCFVVTLLQSEKRKERERNKQHTGWGGGWWWCVAAVIALSVVARCPSTTTETAEEDRRARAPGERNAWFLWTY